MRYQEIQEILTKAKEQLAESPSYGNDFHLFNALDILINAVEELNAATNDDGESQASALMNRGGK